MDFVGMDVASESYVVVNRTAIEELQVAPRQPFEECGDLACAKI